MGEMPDRAEGGIPGENKKFCRIFPIASAALGSMHSLNESAIVERPGFAGVLGGDQCILQGFHADLVLLKHYEAGPHNIGCRCIASAFNLRCDEVLEVIA